MKLLLRSKLFYLSATIAIAAFSAVPAAAQTVVPAKVATINSDAFLDPKSGVTKLVKAFGQLDAEFKPRHDEIDALIKQIDTLNNSTPPAGVTDEKAATDKRAQIDRLSAEIRKKQQDGQAAYDKRMKELTDAIYADLMTSLDAYAKKRGIDVVLDTSKLNGGVYIFNKGVDITTAFIAEYNAKPATP